MLPPGHIAAGYLTGYALLKIANPAVTPIEVQHLILWATFFGFAPDLDMFFTFFKEKAFIIKDVKNRDHRKYYSHAPILWLIPGLLIYFFASSVYFKTFGLVLWLGSWSHFLLDTIEYGIMWLWPISPKLFTLKKVAIVENTETDFWRYWLKMVWQYSKSVSFYLEVFIIITALIIYFK